MLSLAQVATGEAASDRWLAIPDLTPPEIDRLAGNFELRGTYGNLTLAIANEATEEELRRLYPRILRAGDFRPDERVFAIHLTPGELLNRIAETRLLLRRESLAIVGLPRGPDPSIMSVLSQRRPGRFHEGIARVSSRRQRPQPDAPIVPRALDHDQRIQSWVDSVSAAHLESDVIDLSTLFSTRRSDSEEGSEAQQWLVDRFEALGLATSIHSFDDGADNVIAEIPGLLEPEVVVIVGAHYDSLTFSGSAAPGADDNASGTAALLEIARVLTRARAAFRYTLRLVAFASEEFGLVGSNAYSMLMRDQNIDVVAMLNTDMNAHRGRDDPFDLDMVTSNTTAWLTQDLIEIANLYVPDLPIVKGSLPTLTSDHVSFYNDGIPAAFYFEDIDHFSPFIHTSRDLVGLSANDFALSRAIVQAVLGGAAVLAEPIQLSLSGECPGRLEVTVTGMTPNASVFVFAAPLEGRFELRDRRCRGSSIDLARPSLLGTLSTDSGGNGVLTRSLPAARCGLFLQAIDREACAVTHLLRIP